MHVQKKEQLTGYLWVKHSILLQIPDLTTVNI